MRSTYVGSLVAGTLGVLCILLVWTASFNFATPGMKSRTYAGEISCPVSRITFHSSLKPATVAVTAIALCDERRVGFYAGWVRVPVSEGDMAVQSIATQHLGQSVTCASYKRGPLEMFVRALSGDFWASPYEYEDCKMRK